MKATSILKELNLTLGKARKSQVQAAVRAADEGGTIQAPDMVDLIGYAHPTRHTTCSLRQALLWLGCEEA